MRETTTWTYDDGETSGTETAQATGVYKFDMGADQPRESIEVEYLDEKVRYFADGESAVLDHDGTVISGTTEQFGAQDYSGFDTLISHVIGDLEPLIDCTATASKTQSDGLTSYALTLDVDRLIATSEELTTLKEDGVPARQATLTIAFDQDGNVSSMSLSVAFDGYGIAETLEFSDFDNTSVDSAPEATKAYEEVEEDVQVHIQELMKDLDAYVFETDGESSSGTTDAA